ncbi:MAG: hypothetical protein M3N47_06635 [Chloroflexota bacterium]|nr:hypothetical protein [Chloroflexota bacterium]
MTGSRATSMPLRARLRARAHAIAPTMMADRARSYERDFRIRHGITALGERLAAASDTTVRGGPFAGLRYPPGRLADVDAPVAKLVGCYEQEIADIFAEALQGGVEVFVDVGSADGYYAVGMAARNPRLTTYAYDLSRSARQLCAAVAQLNGVGDRVRLRRRCDAGELSRLPLEGAVLLCDIEGGEAEFFDPRTIGLLRRARVVVEAHDGAMQGGLGRQVVRAFEHSHVARVIHPQSRQPDDARLNGWSASERAIAMTESRRPGDHWVDLLPRD